ncbi:hypothetical protein R6Q57_018064 [Mikania cordata]
MKLSQLALLLLLLLLLLPHILLIGLCNAAESNYECPKKCGNVTIHYPFGTKPGCYKDSSYYIQCDPTTQVPRLNDSLIRVYSEKFTRSIEVLEVNLDGNLTVNLPIVHACYNYSGRLLNGTMKSYKTSRFPFSDTQNKLFGVGQHIDAHLTLAEPIVRTSCPTSGQTKNQSLHGVGSCTSVISGNKTYAKIAVKPGKNNTEVGYNECGYAFIVENNKFNFENGDNYSTLTKNKYLPVVLLWSVDNTTCEEAQKDEAYACKDNSVCVNGGDIVLGYRCECAQGFTGNAYIKNGCEDVNECESQKDNDCLPGHCTNTYGSYTCFCPKGFHGNGQRGGECMPDKSQDISVIKGNDTNNPFFVDQNVMGISEGVAGAALTMVLVYLGVNRRRKLKVKEDFFKQNGGIMLQNMLCTSKDSDNKTKIFTEEELKKATDSFNDANIIGQGGYGTVYKGILIDKTIVAIKKSKIIDQSQVNQFVNEVIILSKINHPNVVKLLGCCLETHVPLLVYEYVFNNTLHHHIRMHPTLTLENRLKILEDVAKALAYLHSTIQIIHRDVKSSNILLNDDFTAKVSDFGISTFVPPGQTHLSTFVKGTIGYVDPEYFRTRRLTKESDVYSFGVVLVELLLSTHIHSLEISLTSCNGVVAYLVSLLDQNALVQVLDDQMKKDEYSEVVKCFAEIAISCLNLEGKKRPTMEELKQELKQLRCLVLSIEADSI